MVLNCEEQGFSTTLDPLVAPICSNKDFRLKRHEIKQDQNHYSVCSYIIKKTQSCIYKSSWIRVRGREGVWQKGEGGHVL